MILGYCDYISILVKRSLKKNDENGLIDSVGMVQFDKNQNGSMRSDVKKISVIDINGTGYTITIEENRNDNPI
jgi:type III secretory pathway component EscU